MAANPYTTLAWLPRAAADFRDRARAAAVRSEHPYAEIARLARFALDENQLRVLARAIDAARRRGAALDGLEPLRLGIVGNATLDYLPPALTASAARHGIALECVCADFGQIAQEAFRPDSVINRARLDAVLLAIDQRGLPLASGTSAALALIDELRASFRRHSGAASIVQTLAPPVESHFGNLDARVAETPRALALDFNGKLAAAVGDGDALLDVAAIAESVGLANWHSPKQWHVGKLPFDAAFLPLYADHVARLLGAMRGRSRRALILDLDNTLWGGILGDDGIEGLRIGAGSAEGEAYVAFQTAVLALRERGIVLAVCSKNEDAYAREALRSHPELLLREEHFAAFAIGWNDKAASIERVASDLSLGLSSIVFVDDNPVERDRVRAALPDVAVPELPADPSLYARYLAAAGYFEAVSFTAEDRTRAESYRARATAAQESTAGDLDAYLASLQTRIWFAPFDRAGRERIVALVNKSNQFNLTTRRYNEAQIAAFETDPGVVTVQVRLADRFCDYGVIAVAICRAEGETWEIDTWLMSCRVLGRRVEEALLRELLASAHAHGVRRIVGSYAPTARNELVRDHYAKLGFRLVEERPGGITCWEIDADAEVPAPPIETVRAG